MGKKKEIRQILMDGLQTLQAANADDLVMVANNIAVELLEWRDAHVESSTRADELRRIAATLHAVINDLNRVSSDVSILPVADLVEHFGRYVEPESLAAVIEQMLTESADALDEHS